MVNHEADDDRTQTHVVLTKGTMVAHYRVIEKIGAGGMGEVYLAEDTKLNRRVALKFMPSHLASDVEMRARFKREAQAAAKLNHPNIIVIHEVSEFGERPFFVMEYVEGQSLRDMMKKRDLSVDNIIELVIQICSGLRAAHEKHIIHRDIKPSNIVIDAHWRPKVLDFGLATIQGSDQITKAGSTLGTVGYMSPEQAQGRSVDDRTDVWSLGVVLYELLAGEPPFKADKEQAVVYHILNTPARSVGAQNPSVSSDLDRLVSSMLEKEPARRPSLSEVMAVLSGIIDISVTSFESAGIPESFPTIVGREIHEGLMGDVLNTAARGEARLLCVTGEPGIGKTTLTEDFFRALRSKKEPSLIARGRCSERLAGTEAYLPLLEALENMLRNGHGGHIASTMKQFAPTWFFRITPPQSGEQSDVQLAEDARAASQERMKREFFAFVRELSLRTPVVFFFDDVHWADISTVDLMSYLSSRGDGLKLLIIVTYRPSELHLSDHPFIGVKQELQGRGICEEIVLDFLSQDDISKYLDIEFKGHSFPRDLVDFVHTRTEGNPLFLCSMIGYLQDRGTIIDQDGWHLAKSLSDIEDDIPQSIRSMIERKIDQLEDTDKRLLMTAAVQGADFHAVVVSDALKADQADVEESLERLQQVHALVQKVGEEELPDCSLTLRYRFVHALYQNSLYELLTPARRAQVSLAVGTSLAEHYSEDRASIAGELAILFESARDFAQASDSFAAAASNATNVYASREAIELYHRSIACARKLKGMQRDSRLIHAEFGLANEYMNTAQFDDAIEAFNRAEQVAESTGLIEEQIAAICGRGMALFHIKEIKDMRLAGQEAIDLARSVNSIVGVASAELVLASQLITIGELEKAEPLYKHAISVLKDEKDISNLSLVAMSLAGALHCFREDNEESIDSLNLSLKIARKKGSGFVLRSVYFFKGMALGNQGRLGEAIDVISEALRLADLNQDYYWLPRLPNTLGWLFQEIEDPEEAMQQNLKTVELASELNMGEARANAHVNLAVNHLNLGEPARAHEHLIEAQRIFGEDIWFRWRYNIRLQAVFARYFLGEGDLESARLHAEASLRAARKHQSSKHQAWGLKNLADVDFLEDDPQSAIMHYDESLTLLAKNPCPTIEWKVLKASADLAKKLGDEQGSDEYRSRARSIVKSLADSLADDKIRTKFLKSRAVKSI